MSVIQENISLMPFNTFHLDVKARYLVELEDVSQVRDFITSSLARTCPGFILGGGSNVLFTGDFNGIVIRPVIKGIEKLQEDRDSVLIRVGAGENWDSFVAWSVEGELSGIENLSLIPGSVGASPIQNIGAYGMEVKDVIHAVEAVTCDDGKMITFMGNDCRFGYRDSLFKHELLNRVIITHVIYRLNKRHTLKINYADLEKELARYSEPSIKAIREAIITIRRSKLPDPDDIGNAGSFFKNPVVPADQLTALRRIYPDIPGHSVDPGMVKLSAAWLIDRCGWKGKRVGNTGSYINQPLILVNHGGATGKEILTFARGIQKSVMDRFSLRLEMEVNIV